MNEVCGVPRVELINEQMCKGTPLELMQPGDRVKWYNLDLSHGKKLVLVEKGGVTEARHCGDMSFEICRMPSRNGLQSILERYGYSIMMS